MELWRKRSASSGSPAFRTYAGWVSEAEKPLENGESEYQIYYMNQAVTKLIAQPYRTKTTDTEALIGELMENLLHVPADLEAQVVLSDKVVYQGCRKDDTVLYLFFDNNYTSMNACQEILCRRRWPGP